MKALVAAAVLFASVAHAAVGTVTWTPAPQPTLNGVPQAYTDFRLYRCLGAAAICPTSNAALWTVQDTFPVTDCGSGTPPCTATTTVSVAPGTSVTMSFYMTARIGTGTGQESPPSQVIAATVSAGDIPLLPPGTFTLQFSALAVPLKVVDGTIGEGGKIILAATAPNVVNDTILVHVIADRRKHG